MEASGLYADSRTAPFHQEDIPPAVVHPADAFTPADDSEPAAPVERQAGRILGKDPRLQGPNPCPLGLFHQRVEPVLANAVY